MKNLNLTPNDRYVIAEFVYSNQTDILIISDCINIVDVFFKHSLITADKKTSLIQAINQKTNGVVENLERLLTTNISEAQGKAIMDEYYGRHKYEI